MQALPAAPAPAPRNQLTVGASLAAAAIVMLFGGMLAVWAVQRSRAIDVEGTLAARRRRHPRSALQRDADRLRRGVHLRLLGAVVGQASGLPAHRPGPRATAFMGLLILNAQFFVYHELGLGVADGAYASMFYAITGTFVALLILGMLVSVVAAFRFLGGRTGDHELLVAHSIVWYAITAVYCGIWFLVYVTK